jgi:hypothetical protein
VRGWNEIDAVALVAASGQRVWAEGVSASSSYPSRLMNVTSRSSVPGWYGPPPPPGVAQWIIVVGFPMRCLRRVERTYTSAQTTSRWRGARIPRLEVLPRQPIWTGLLVNVIVFTLALRIVVLIVQWCCRRPIRFLREAGRTRKGWCAACGFDLRFDLARGCPECGWRRVAPDQPELEKGTRPST